MLYVEKNYTVVLTMVFILIGPGLAIRVICGDEIYQGNDAGDTNIILGQIVDFAAAVRKV